MLQVDELLAVVQYVMLGKLPINFIGQKFLYSILHNISLKLPDQYDMIISPRLEDIHLFYSLIRVGAIGNAHGVKLVMHVPIKTAIQHFTVHRIIALPIEMGNDKFVKY
jgi:hypothetical protein